MCWEGAWAESFNATLKNERVHRMVHSTRKKAINDIASWIELTYNHTRLHSALGYARTQRGRTRTPGGPESSLTNTTTTVRKTSIIPDTPSFPQHFNNHHTDTSPVGKRGSVYVFSFFRSHRSS
ncbi:hypothetical protein MANAM107_06930 [Actinomyces capricornis]|uniref:Integrase catalytic domain-containing protein n=1 Tax=Actinomyces capricornis TaxID=2755559 RepID=A0ABM7UEV8_9ACTO|nr:hypothetical protein MANAM107_06930 [Actinomyces capricornis]